MEGRVDPERVERLGQPVRPQQAAPELDELGVDPLDLREPGGVNRLRLEVERRVDADGRPVRLGAARDAPRTETGNDP